MIAIASLFVRLLCDCFKPQSSSPPEQDDRPSHALNSDPSGIALPNSSPNIESDVPTPVAPETAKKKHPAKKMKPKSSPGE
jgi:hypothetical protein